MNERDMQIHCARVYLAQARITKHRNWAFVLLGWVANCRNRARERVAGAGKVFGHNHIEDSRGMVGQMELFA